MSKLKYIKTYNCRRALSAGCAVFGALIVSYYYSLSNEYWMMFTAFLTSMTTRGTPLRQSLIIFSITASALIVSSIFLMNINIQSVIYSLVAIVFIFSAYMSFINRPQTNITLFLMILFSIVFMIATLSPLKSVEIIQYRVLDAALGSIIGVFCTFIIAPVNLDKEFSAGMVPILTSLNEFSQALIKDMFNSLNDKVFASEIRIKVETSLQTYHGVYPEWVYEPGFNRGLRSGFRFFLINIERVAEIFFSMDYLLARGIDKQQLLDLKEVIENTMKKNQELISILINYFETKMIYPTQSDFTGDMKELEKALHSVVPDNLEALEISPKFLLITALVRELRDLRGLLLQLVMALPTTKNQL